MDVLNGAGSMAIKKKTNITAKCEHKYYIDNIIYDNNMIYVTTRFRTKTFLLYYKA